MLDLTELSRLVGCTLLRAPGYSSLQVTLCLMLPRVTSLSCCLLYFLFTCSLNIFFKSLFIFFKFRIPACLLGQFTAEIVRLLRVMVGSVDTAFKNYKHRPLLNELFSLVVKCHLSPSPDDQTCGPSPLVRSLCQSSEVQYLPLCDDIMVRSVMK